MVDTTETVAPDGQLPLTQGTLTAKTLKDSEISRILADLLIIKDKNLRDIVTEHITSIYDVLTPKEKVLKRADGFDYVESTWMDKTFKEFSPIYEYQLVMHNESLDFIDIIVSLKDRLTGNTELGGGSSRVQRSNQDKSFILDKGNNLKTALTNAIKNAQSRFGVCADVYRKREHTRTPDEISRQKSMFLSIKKINSSRAQMFKTQWDDLGVDFTEYLDRWQVYIDRNIKISVEDAKSNTSNSEGK